MAATNYTPIQLYYSTTASAVPLAANLAQGELAINIADGKLYYEDSTGVVQVIATKGAGTIGGSDTQIQYNNAGALAGNAAMTFNSGTSTVTLTTLNLTNALGATYGGTAQSTYTQGDILYSSAANTLAKLGIGTANYILTSTGSVPQWVAPSSVTVQTANNLAGGAAGSVPYQSAADTTTFLAIGTANRVMTSTGSAPQWVTSLSGLTGVSSSSITNTSLTSGRVVLSTAGGQQTDDADLTFDGTTLSAGGLSTTGFSTQVKTVTIGNSNFNGVAVFAPSTPAKLYVGTGTVTDVTSAAAATNTIGAISSLAITPIAATNASVTYTNAATLYIAGAPSASTNVTITNPYSFYVAGGASYFGGAVDFAVTPSYSGGTANGVMYLNGSKQITTGSALEFDGTNFSLGGGGYIRTASGGEIRAYNTANTRYGRFATIADGTIVESFDGSNEPLILSAPQAGAPIQFKIGGSEQMRLTSANLLVGLSTALANGKLQVAGSIGLSGNTEIRQATNSDGNTLRLLATQVVVGNTNAQSYNYIGGGLLASVSSSASAILLDVGGANAGHRLQVVNDGTGQSGNLNYSNAGASRFFVNSLSGYAGFGTASPSRPLDISSAVSVDTTGSADKWTASFRDTTATAAAGVGGSLLFQGLKSTAGSVGNFGAIAGLKENSVDGNESGALAFYTVSNATGLIAERARIDSAGAFLVNTTSTQSTAKLVVHGGDLAIQTINGSPGDAFPSLLFYNNNSSGFINASITATVGATINSGNILFKTNSSGAFDTRLTINQSGYLLFGTATANNYLNFPAASNALGISWENYANVFGEYSSGAVYLSSNYYPTPGAAGYKTTITASYGAAGMSLNGTGGAANGGLIQFYVSPATSKTAGAAFSPTEVGRFGPDGLLQIGRTAGSAPDGKLQVGATGTGAGAANTKLGFALIEDDSGNGAGLWLGAMTNENTGVIGSRTATGNIAFQTYNGGWGERARITYDGNLLVGTNNSSGDVSNTANIYGGRFRTVSGSVSVSTGTATTLLTVPATLSSWIIAITANTDDAGSYSAVVSVNTQFNNSTKVTVLVAASQLTFSMSNYSLQVTQGSGTTIAFSYSAQRIL